MTKFSSPVRLALLTTLSLLLFTVEGAFPPPVPIPGVKLGLANVVTVWALYHGTAAQTALVLASRVLLSALFSGGASALLFSACGGALCLLGMLPLRRVVPKKRMWLTSACGGMLHNIGQLGAAVFAAGSDALWSYLPFLLAAGLICGSLTGAAAAALSARLERVLGAAGARPE